MWEWEIKIPKDLQHRPERRRLLVHLLVNYKKGREVSQVPCPKKRKMEKKN